MISDIPWHGPIGCVRVGEINGEFVVNPTNEQLYDSSLDLVYVGNENEMMMIEGSADQVPEDRFIEALEFAHKAIQPLIKAQHELAALCGKTKREFALYTVKPEVLDLCKTLVGERLKAAVFQDKKMEREAAVNALKEEAKVAYKASVSEEAFEENQVSLAFEHLQEKLYRESILERGERVDNRKADDLRDIMCKAGVLPCVHGSALFQRGETQAIVTATLGTSRDAQDMDALTGGAQAKSFILHYNFPPYSVGEVGRFGFTGRREIGHGALAERSLLPIMPTEEDFGYAIRLVSDIMESNGSSSMASVCGGCMALMDAGVPILAPVAGISAGLITETDASGKITKHVVLTDILGAEDHFGDMDFKVCGTRLGVTGFQLDLKIKGLPFNIAREAIAQVTKVRYNILDVMLAELPQYRPELRESAPRIHQMQIDPDKIGLLIGPGGKNIKRITEVSGAQININEDNSGKVSVYATTKASMDRAVGEIDLLMGDIEVGKTYRGIVRGVKEFGAFVECLPGKEGLVHVSELSDVRVANVEDVCKMGDEIVVQCIGVDDKGRVRLSRKAVICEAKGIPYVAQERSEGRDSRGGGRFGRGRDEEPRHHHRRD
ncbi:MAG: polyribonucleotide nucleotidyltransferase [Verrucomicrobia bacterium 21-51-4]|nr:MAG: polyribonucleotide nucleotidyltransferase [Verrucomicrobia bacterium 21-51-4]